MYMMRGHIGWAFAFPENMQREAAQALQRKRGQESMEQVHQQRFTEQESQHDACGIGAVVNISGQRTHRAVDDALKIVEKLEHRTGKDADGTTGDGVGIMTQLPYAFFEKTARQVGKPLPEAGDYGVAMIFFRRIRSNVCAAESCWR